MISCEFLHQPETCLHPIQFGTRTTEEQCISCQLHHVKTISVLLPGKCIHLGSERKCCGYNICRLHKTHTMQFQAAWNHVKQMAPSEADFAASVKCCETCGDHQTPPESTRPS